MATPATAKDAAAASAAGRAAGGGGGSGTATTTPSTPLRAVSSAEELKTVSPAPVPTFTAVKAAGPVPTTVAPIVRNAQQQSSGTAPPGLAAPNKPTASDGKPAVASAHAPNPAPTPGGAIAAPAQTGGGRGAAAGTRGGGRGGRGQPLFLSGRAGSPYQQNAAAPPPAAGAGGGAIASVFQSDGYGGGGGGGGGGYRGRGGGGYRQRRYSTDASQYEGSSVAGDGDGVRYRRHKQFSGRAGGAAEGDDDDRDAFNRDNYKTEICRTHLQHGFCEYEDNCQFAHGVNELRPRHFGAKYKTQLCKNYHNDGACRFGSRCKFIHDEHRVRVSEKEFWLISPSENLVRVERVDNPQRQAELAALVVSQDRMAQVLGPGGQALAAAAAANTTASAAATMMPIPVRPPAAGSGAAPPAPQVQTLQSVSIGADAEDVTEQQLHTHHLQGGASTPASGLVTPPGGASVTPLVLPAQALMHGGGTGTPAQLSPAMHVAPAMPDLNLAALQHSGAVMFGEPPASAAASGGAMPGPGSQGLVPLMPPNAISAAGVPIAALPYRPATQMGVYYVPAPAAIAAGANPMPQPLPVMPMFYAPPQPQPMPGPAAAASAAPPTHRVHLPPLPMHAPPPLMAASGCGYNTPVSPATVTSGSGASSVSNSPAHAHAAQLHAHMQYLSLGGAAPPGAGHGL